MAVTVEVATGPEMVVVPPVAPNQLPPAGVATAGMAVNGATAGVEPLPALNATSCLEGAARVGRLKVSDAGLAESVGWPAMVTVKGPTVMLHSAPALVGGAQFRVCCEAVMVMVALRVVPLGVPAMGGSITGIEAVIVAGVVAVPALTTSQPALLEMVTGTPEGLLDMFTGRGAGTEPPIV